MIEYMSLKLANRLKSVDPDDTPSVNVLRYSIKFLLLNIITVLLVLISGLILGDLTDVMISLIGFAGLRFFSGGYHVTTAWLCAIVSCSILQINVWFASHVLNDQAVLVVLQVITLMLISVFSPSNIAKQTKFKKENYKWLKVFSILLCLLNILVLKNDLLTAAFFLQGLSLIRFHWKEVQRE